MAHVRSRGIHVKLNGYVSLHSLIATSFSAAYHRLSVIITLSQPLGDCFTVSISLKQALQPSIAGRPHAAFNGSAIVSSTDQENRPAGSRFLLAAQRQRGRTSSPAALPGLEAVISSNT